MLWIHPLVQFAAFLIAIYAFYLGYKRFAATQLGKKGPFAWKQHVRLGSLAMFIWLPGLGLGLWLAWWSWSNIAITGAHYTLGMLMIPFIIFGYVSGWVMDRQKAKRKVLPLLHGGNNLLLVLLSLAQLGTGIQVIRAFLLP